MEGMEKLSFSARSPPEPHHHQASQVYGNVLAVITSMCREMRDALPSSLMPTNTPPKYRADWPHCLPFL